MLVASLDPYGAALIGAIGVVIGGLITAASGLLIERWRGKRLSRAAARLVLAELSEILQAISEVVKTGVAWRSEDRQLPAFAWREYRAVLAIDVSNETWMWLASAYEKANDLNWRVIELERETTERPVPIKDKESLRGPIRAVDTAMMLLENTLGPKAGIYHYTGYRSSEELEASLFGQGEIENASKG